MKQIIDLLFNSKLLRFARAVALPRWAILLADCAIIVFCCSIIFLLKLYILPEASISFFQSEKWLLILGVYFAMEYLTKNHTYVIRLSIVEDLYRVFIMNLLSTLTLIVINFFYSLAYNSQIFHYSTIIVLGTLIMSMMFMVRLCVKYLYSSYIRNKSLRKNVIIFGNSLNSIFFANAMKNEYRGKYNPVAILSDAPSIRTRGVNGLAQEKYVAENVKEIFQKYDSRTLVCLSENLHILQNNIADNLLKNGIEILAVNASEKLSDINNQEEANISAHVRNIQIEDLLGRDTIKTDKEPVKELIEGNVVLVSGAAGSIGSEIVRQVAAYGANRIVLIDQAETPMHDMQLEMREKFPDINISLFVGDIQNAKRMEQAFKQFRPKYVFHAAAYKHVPMMEINPSEAILTNVGGTRIMADLALKYNVLKFVMISTDKAVNPTNIMGTTKRIAEVYVQSLFFNAQKRGKKTQFITTRFGNVLGSNGSVIPLFRSQIEKGGPVTVTHKDIIRYFMTIPEACSLVLEAGCMGKGGEIYVFDMGQPVKIYDLAYKMITLAGLRPDIDIKIIETGLRPGEKLYEELLNNKEKTRATVNKKIMISTVPVYDYANACNNIDRIVAFANDGKIHEMVTAMKQFIPEYKSQNSIFEKIDSEIKEAAEDAKNGVFVVSEQSSQGNPSTPYN